MIQFFTKRYAALALLPLAFNSLAEQAESQALDISPYIVNGSRAETSDYPSFVSLFLDAEEYGLNYMSTPYCGGTLLSDEYVLTAAHCIYGSDDAQLLTMVAPNLQYESDYPNAEKQRVVAIYHPSDYSDDIYRLVPNDIAILQLANPLSIGSPIQMPTDESYRSADSTFTAVGHGNTEYGYDAFDVLQKVNLTWVDNLVCAGDFTDGYYLTDKQICFTGDYSEATELLAGTCQGDSGGPIYWDNNGNQVQVGITSFGPVPCGDKERAVTSVFTEIADYSDWIQRVLNGQEDPTYISTDELRKNYLKSLGYRIEEEDTDEPKTDNGQPDGSDSGSGGGSLHWGLLILLGGLAWKRRWRLK
ncbi:S1 family peptidase [Vibrio hangzhouensis]|uniref:S1 family peptidase n=1 Tax=Vibrio hangzhouensis TaxID=462991 RepID=UPI001C962C89|nr:serine protease [Vibrio hangzhouensis]MBY6196244.1 serine protease [Vibrio hangzhouensis]